MTSLALAYSRPRPAVREPRAHGRGGFSRGSGRGDAGSVVALNIQVRAASGPTICNGVRGAARRRTSLSALQVAQPEDSSGVVVGEVDADSVVADQVHVLDREIFGHRAGVEQALAGGLGLAVRAAAADPQLAGAPHVLVPGLVPYEPDLALPEADDLQWHGHVRGSYHFVQTPGAAAAAGALFA